MDFNQYLEFILIIIGLIVTVILAAVGFKAEEQVAKKTCKRLAGFLLCLIVGLTIIYVYSNYNDEAKEALAIKTEVINNCVFEAQKLADENDYIGAISLLKATLSEYPDDVQLSEKLKLYEDILSQYESILDGLLQEISAYISEENYSQAIILIEDALKLYPGDLLLKEMHELYTGIVLEEEKTQILAEAESLFASSEYEKALSLIQAAQDIYGTAVEFGDVYRSYHKEYTLFKAEEYIAGGDYVNSMKVLTEGLEVCPNDVGLISHYHDCRDTYVNGIISEADLLTAEWKIDEAISVVKAALKILPNDEKLEAKLATLKDSMPIPITALASLNKSEWEWNDGVAKDPFGNDYSSMNNYVIFDNQGASDRTIEYRIYGNYQMLTGVISPHSDIGERITCSVTVYADDIPVYTSPTVVQKMDAFNFAVDLSGAEYVRMEVRFSDWNPFDVWVDRLIIADVNLWP